MTSGSYACAKDFADDFRHCEDVLDVGAVVRHAARAVTGAQGATFVLRDDDRCFYLDEDAIAPLWKGQRFPIDTCVSGWAMMNSEPALIADIHDDERIPLEAYAPTFVRSMMMVPAGCPPAAAIGAYWATARDDLIDRLPELEALAALVSTTVDRVGLDAAPAHRTYRKHTYRRPRF